jgi:VanZ family protein
MRVPLALRLLAGAAFLLMTAGLFVGGAQPEAAGMFDSHWDKVAHFAFFAALAGLLTIAADFRHPVLVLAAVATIGIADELAQTQLPGRHADLPDLATDLGAAACAVIFLVWARRRLLARRGA